LEHSSPCRTPLRRVSAEHSSFAAIEVIAAHYDGRVPACSNTIRTARSRASGENRTGLARAPILSRIGASGKPARFNHHVMCCVDEAILVAKATSKKL
jgi:hypothetical protein